MKVLGKMVPSLLGTLFKKNSTVLYPAVPAKVPPRFRGMLKFDQDKCIGCSMCVRVCPAKAISITKVESEPEVKKFKATVRLDRCLFCGQCVESCPKKALENTEVFELAALSRDALKRDI